MPKFEIKEHIGCTKKLHVEIERERYDQEFALTLKGLKKDFQIPGFRKGKAPESIIARRFSSTIREETVKELIPKVLKEMYETEGIKPLNKPSISDFVFDKTGPITFTVVVEELPEIDLSVFDTVKVTKEITEITEEDIDNSLDRLRELKADRKEVDREAREGDILTADFLRVDPTGVTIIGEKKEQHVISLDKVNLHESEFLEHLLGMKKGDQRKVRITVEESPDSRELTGGAEVYNVEVLQVVEFIIPELNDEFAVSLGGYKDLADLREKTRVYLEKQAELDAEDNLKSDLIEEFIKHNPFEVPGSMVTRVLSADFENMKKNRPDQEIDEEEYYTRMRPNAVRAVQTYLIIDKIKSEKNIDVTKEEISERIEIIAQENGMDPREFRRLLIKDGRLDEIKNDIAEEKTYRWMVETANVKVVRTKKKTEKSNIIIPNWRM